MISGPIVPKYFNPPTIAGGAPTPVVLDPTLGSATAGEIITCSQTGRMWVNYRNTEMVPIRPEFFHNDAYAGASTSGVRKTLLGAVPFQYAGVEIYGAGLVVSGTASISSSLSCAGYTQLSGTHSVATASPITLASTDTSPSNVPLIQGKKPTLSNQATLLGDRYEISAFLNLGVEIGDYTAVGGAFTQRALINKSYATFNVPLKLTGTTNAPALGTDSNGQVVAKDLQVNQAFVVPSFTSAATGAWEMVDDGSNPIEIGVGTAGVTQSVCVTALFTFNHVGNYEVSAAIFDGTGRMVGSSVSANGYSSIHLSKTTTITGPTTFSMQIRTAHPVQVLRRDAYSDVDTGSFIEAVVLG